jgi:DnaJ-domain-containing protein 1
VIDVLYFSDKAVNEKLFARVKHAKKLTLVTVLPPHRAGTKPTTLEPFASLEQDFGDVLDQVLVVDEGKIEGMWRDPVVDLADALHEGDKKASYAAARGYFFVQAGAWKATVKKTNDHDDDLERLEKIVEKLTMRRAPERAKRPERPERPEKKKARSSRAQNAARTIEDEVPVYSANPWEILGIEPGASLADAKKAWKSLMTLYHPDKVAHLAPEFKELAEEKTRQIMTAWEQVQAELSRTRD